MLPWNLPENCSAVSVRLLIYRSMATAETTAAADGVPGSAVASDVPEVAALKDYLKNLERTYLQHRAKIEQVVARDSGKVKDIRKKLEKIKKYVDDMLSSL